MDDKTQMDMSLEAVFDSEKYQLIAKIGEGGFGVVYQAKQLSTQQFVAIKFLSLASSFDQDKKRRYIERFHRESDLVRRLNHPNIVSLIDKGQQGDSLLYAVYEYIDGFSLKEHLDNHGPFDAPQAAELMACVLDALSHAHDQGVIHRDIKPANIMLYKVGAKTHVKVLDFGIGTLKNEARQLDYKTITLTQETLGTPSYSAPEQLRGEPPVAQTDIYVWGLVFLECLTGTPTITGSSLASIFHQQLSPANVPLGILAGHNSANFFRRVLNKKVQERPGNTTELYHDFRQLNFSNLVGDLSQIAGVIQQNSPANAITANDLNETLVHEGQFSYSRLTERKQISVLSIILKTEALTTEASTTELSQGQPFLNQHSDQDVIDTFHSDQMQQCIDIAIRYGANHVGSLGDTLLFYFGYPHVTDNDSRLCSRAALDITSNVNKKNSLLKNSQGISSHIQMGIQIGQMLSLANNLPEGKAAHDAMSLCRQAKDGQILCSENVKHLLEGYLHFEGVTPNKQHNNVGSTKTQAIYQLRGERQSEAFGFLRGTRKNSAFIGREQELTTLINLLTLNNSNINDAKECPKLKEVKEAVPAKTVKLAHVHGEAGIGKSRLVFELRARAPKMQHFVAQCLPEHQNNALYPILHCLKFKYSLDALSDENSVIRLQQAIASTSLTAEHQQHGLQVLTAWLNLPLEDNNVLGNLSPEIQKQRLFAVISQLFCQTSQVSIASSQGKQHLFIFEDLHWADPTSKEFINYIVQTDEFTQGQHTWINTSREVLPDGLAELPFTLVPIEKLSPNSTAEFINYLFEQQTLAKRLSELLIERTDGIPLFVEELASTLQKQTLVHKVNGIIDFVDNDKQSQVPATLRDSLQQKLDGLKLAKDTAQLAATIGRAFNYDLLVATSNKDETQVQTDLDELIKAEIVFQQRQVDGDSYIFKHALVRDAAYESMLKTNREQIHASIAKTYETHFIDIVKARPMEVAQHHSGATNYSEAVTYGIRAIKASNLRSTHLETITIGKQALLWNNQRSDIQKNTQSELEINNLIYTAIMAVEGLGANELTELTRRNNDLRSNLAEAEVGPTLTSDFMTQYTAFSECLYNAKGHEAIDIAENIIVEARAKGQRELELVVLPLLGFAYHTIGDLSNAEKRFNWALTLYEEESDQNLWLTYGTEPKSWALFMLGISLACRGLPEQGRAKCEEAIIWGKQTGCTMSTDAAVVDLAVIAHLCEENGKINALSRYFEDSNRSTTDEWLTSNFRMLQDISNDQTTSARENIESLRELGRIGILAWFEAPLADAEIRKGNYQTAIDYLLPVAERLLKHDDLWVYPLVERSLMEAYYLRDKRISAQVEIHFQNALAETKRQRAQWIELKLVYSYCRILKQEDKKKDISTWLAPLLPRFTEGHSTTLFQEAQSLYNSAN